MRQFLFKAFKQNKNQLNISNNHFNMSGWIFIDIYQQKIPRNATGVF